VEREQKKAIQDYVNTVDPHGDVVHLQPSDDFSSGTVNFANEIVQHRVEGQLKAEKWIEAYIITKLSRELGYLPNCLELQKEYPAGHPETTHPRVDIVVYDRRTAPTTTFMLIEAKSPEDYESQKVGIEGQLFGLGDHERPHGLKYLVYYTADFSSGRLLDRAIVIDARRFLSFQAWDNAGRPSLDQLPTGYATAVKSVYVNKPDSALLPGERNLNSRFSRNEFLALRRDLHNVLWGGGGTPDNDVFSNLVKLFLAKIYDEEFTPEGQSYTFQILFKDGEPQPPSEVVSKLNGKSKLPGGYYEGLFRRAQKEYLELSDEEILASQGLDAEKISPGKMAYVVESLQGISLTRNEGTGRGDVLGEFFEGIVGAGFKQSKGQFFTHTNIVKFCIYALKLDDLVETKIRNENTLPFIVDPACGSGTFLIEAMRTVTKTVRLRNLPAQLHLRARQLVASWFPLLKENIWAREFIYGIEINADLALATKVNMVLHGDGNINVLIRDGLLDFERYSITKKLSTLARKQTKVGFPYECPTNEQFDVLLSNPPFSVDLDNETKRGPATRFLYADKHTSENLFIERWYQLLKPGGRMAVVLPEAFFDTGENDYIRLFLFKFFHPKAIVSLPELAFKPWTPTRTSLLFATKKSDDEVRAYDNAWRQKDTEFRRLREAGPIAHVIKGDRLLQNASRLCTSYGILSPVEGTAVQTINAVRNSLTSLMARADFRPTHAERLNRYLADIQDWLAVDPDTAWPTAAAYGQIRLYLKTFFGVRYDGKPISALIDRHWEEMVRIASSPWWIFTELAHLFPEDIAYFEVENIGYKRTTNREREAPNDLFSMSAEIEPDDPATVLGQLRSQVAY
jgi:type I restriction enzyme M protein